VVEKEARRLERQAAMSLAVDDLPKHCAVGTKRNAKGHTTSWIGYKLHLDVSDGDIPVSGLLSSASLHDSQAAIPLATLTAGRLTNLYDLMDSAYDAPEIKQHSRSLGHVPIIVQILAQSKSSWSRQRSTRLAQISTAASRFPARKMVGGAKNSKGEQLYPGGAPLGAVAARLADWPECAHSSVRQ
jgi:hypothetical protein